MAVDTYRRAMSQRLWSRPVGADATAEVRLESGAEAGAVRYRIAFPFLVGDDAADDLQVTGEGRVADHQLRSEGGLPVSDVVVSIPGEFDVERLLVRSREERLMLYLPSPALIELVEQAVDGDGAAAEALLDRFDTPVQVPLVCGSFLGVSGVVDLIAALARADRYAASVLHSYRYAIVRGALASRAGLHIEDLGELRALVEGLDGIEQIGALSVVEAIGDVVATVHDTRAETEALLEALDADYGRLDEESDGLLTACLLAQIVCTEGVEAAQAFEVPRKLPPRGHYDRRKRAVFQAEYGERGRAWRRLLNAARRQSADEIGYVLAYALYWTGEESRTDARLDELLLRGAERVAEHKRLVKLETKAQYRRLIAAGHRLRGAHCFGPAAANFAAARTLAAEYDALPEWEPILAEGLVRSRALSKAGDVGAAVDTLDRTIEALLASGPPTPVANRSVRHLTAQKAEIDAERYRSEAPRLARHLLEEARAHYAALGFERSRAKVERLLDSLPEAVTAGEPASPEAPAPLPTEPAATAGDAVEAAGDGAGPELEGASADDEDWLEHVDYGDDEAARRAYEETFDDAYAG